MAKAVFKGPSRLVSRIHSKGASLLKSRRKHPFPTDMPSAGDVAVLLVSAGIGVALKAFYDELSSPWLQFEGFDPVVLGGPVGSGFVGFQPSPPTGQYRGIRLKIRNREKVILNRQAENCLAWLLLESSTEKFQISWVPSVDAVRINPGDFRYVDLCARDVSTGAIVAPTERGYFVPIPRVIGTGIQAVYGRVDVTCSNGHPISRSIRIVPAAQGTLDVEFV